MHFLFKIFDSNLLIGLFVPVNESVWEHIKMLIIPMILWWGIYYIYNKNNINKEKWFAGLVVAMIVSIVTIPLLFYFYTQAFGVEILWVDILILFLAVAFGQLTALHYYKYGKGFNVVISVAIILLIVCLFMYFTINPPHIPLFKDSVTGRYGLN